MAAGGVPQLTHLLAHPAAPVAASALALLSGLAGNAVAQESIRWEGGSNGGLGVGGPGFALSRGPRPCGGRGVAWGWPCFALS